VLKQQEQNDVLGDFTKRLDKIGIEYMLVGSMALVHYAMPRATVDIDIVVNILPENLSSFVKEFEADYYIPLQNAENAVRQKRMFNVLNQETVVKIDCVVLNNDEFQILAFSRRKKVNYSGDFDVWIISKEDLIISKLIWAKKSGSERQLLDVAGIIRNGFDENYVGEWIAKLELEEVFAESKRLLQKNYDARYDS
jgi:hypothetical protein